MTDKIATTLKEDMDGITLSPFGDGRFEVFVDDQLIYSKLETGEFPDEAAILKQIAG